MVINGVIKQKSKKEGSSPLLLFLSLRKDCGVYNEKGFIRRWEN